MKGRHQKDWNKNRRLSLKGESGLGWLSTMNSYLFTEDQTSSTTCLWLPLKQKIRPAAELKAKYFTPLLSVVYFRVPHCLVPLLLDHRGVQLLRYKAPSRGTPLCTQQGAIPQPKRWVRKSSTAGVLYVYSLHAICYHRERMFGLMKKLRAANSEAICRTVVDHISLELARVFHVTTTFFFKVRFWTICRECQQNNCIPTLPPLWTRNPPVQNQ